MFDHGFVGSCFNSNRLLDQSVKELTTVTAGSSIKPERILVEVVIKMFMANPTFAIRGEKRLFLGMHRPVTLDFKGVNFQNGL